MALFKLLQYDGLDFIEEYRVLLGLPVFNIAEDEWIILFESFQIYFFC